MIKKITILLLLTSFSVTFASNYSQNFELASTTVVDIIVDSPDHESLEAAVIAAGLAETLSGEGPFTVFAPTDAAFAALGSDVIDDLFADPTGDLANILLHHVHDGLAMSSDLEDGMPVSVLYGNDLTIMFTSDGGIKLDNANIVLTAVDLPADNGTVHVIDAVLDVDFELASTTVVDIIVDSPDHESLEAAVIAAGLAETLSGEGPFTVFAPTDAAFAALGSDVIDDLFADPTGDLANILLHHVHDGLAMSSDLEDGMPVPVLYGNDLTVMFTSDGGIKLDNANIVLIAVDLPADNGTVHVIDAVLILEEETAAIFDIIPNIPNRYIYSINVLGEKVDRFVMNQIIFDVFDDGSIIKRFNR